MIAPLLVLAWFFQAPTTFTVSGTVVNGVTGKPLSKARVTLAGSGKDPVVTGPDGKFRFDGVPQGKHNLSAERLGFTRQAYQQRVLGTNYSTGVVTGERENTQDLVFGLIPGGVLTGTVTDTTGNPVEGIHVAVIRVAGVGAYRHIQRISYDWTDDRGMYRIASLPAGSYIVGFLGRAPGRTSPPTTQPSTYPVSYFPGVSNPVSAALLTVEPGKETPANFVLAPVPAVHIIGSVVNSLPQDRIDLSRYRVTLAIAGPFGQQFAVGTSVATPGPRFTFPDVGAGRYFINVTNQQGKLVGRKEIEVADSDLNVEIPPSSMADISAKVEIRGTPKLADRPVILVLNNVNGLGRSNFPGDAQGQVHITGLPAGEYEIGVSKGDVMAVQQVDIEGTTERSGLLQVPEIGTVRLRIVANANVAQQVKGRVFRGDHPESGMLAVLVPAKSWEDLLSYRFDQSDSDGTFSWQAVAPGDYLMFALEQGDAADYTDAEVIRKLAPKGQPVTVTSDPGQSVRVQVTNAGF